MGISTLIVGLDTTSQLYLDPENTNQLHLLIPDLRSLLILASSFLQRMIGQRMLKVMLWITLYMNWTMLCVDYQMLVPRPLLWISRQKSKLRLFWDIEIATLCNCTVIHCMAYNACSLSPFVLKCSFKSDRSHYLLQNLNMLFSSAKLVGAIVSEQSHTSYIENTALLNLILCHIMFHFTFPQHSTFTQSIVSAHLISRLGWSNQYQSLLLFEGGL